MKELHKHRKVLTQTKVDQAILRLTTKHKSINFNSVAEESGVSKKTLYDTISIRERIEALRSQEISVPSPREVKRSMSEQNKDALIASLKRKIHKLEDENKLLKEKLKINYGEYYKNI